MARALKEKGAAQGPAVQAAEKGKVSESAVGGGVTIRKQPSLDEFTIVAVSTKARKHLDANPEC